MIGLVEQQNQFNLIFPTNLFQKLILKTLSTSTMFESQKDLYTHRTTNSYPIDLAFRNLTYTVQIQDQDSQSCLSCFQKKKEKNIIKNVSGIFKSGQLSAIMGPSGAGKTTLLNVLACRIPTQKLSGSISANGNPYNFQRFGQFANYVMQKDLFMQTLTVRQTLQFAASLKLNTTQQEKTIKINDLIRTFKLEKCIDVLVGGQTVKGISGGEKKRMSIVFQLITDPQVLILDQPTSGLDSLTSFVIISHLRKLTVQRGKTIFMTIHQPNTEIFQQFDRLMLMIQGRLIYQGPARDAVNYFSSHFGLTCGQFMNPADYFMSVMHQQTSKNQQRFPRYIQAYQRFQVPGIERQLQNQKVGTLMKRGVDVSYCTELKVLISRDFLNSYRNPMMLSTRALTIIFLSVYMAGIPFQFSGEYVDRVNWNALTGYLFFLAIDTLMINIAPTSLSFPLERSVFLKEEGAKLYSTSAYFLSRSIAEIPVSIILPLLRSLIMYWFSGLSNTASQFFIFYLICYLLIFNGVSLGLLVGSVIFDEKSVSNVINLAFIPFWLFSGYFKNTANLPDWIGWIQYISPIKYGFSSWIQNQVHSSSNSNIHELNLDVSLWLGIGLMFILAFAFRICSMFFLWKLRTRLE